VQEITANPERVSVYDLDISPSPLGYSDPRIKKLIKIWIKSGDASGLSKLTGLIIEEFIDSNFQISDQKSDLDEGNSVNYLDLLSKIKNSAGAAGLYFFNNLSFGNGKFSKARIDIFKNLFPAQADCFLFKFLREPQLFFIGEAFYGFAYLTGIKFYSNFGHLNQPPFVVGIPLFYDGVNKKGIFYCSIEDLSVGRSARLDGGAVGVSLESQFILLPALLGIGKSLFVTGPPAISAVLAQLFDKTPALTFFTQANLFTNIYLENLIPLFGILSTVAGRIRKALPVVGLKLAPAGPKVLRDRGRNLLAPGATNRFDGGTLRVSGVAPGGTFLSSPKDGCRDKLKEKLGVALSRDYKVIAVDGDGTTYDGEPTEEIIELLVNIVVKLGKDLAIITHGRPEYVEERLVSKLRSHPRMTQDSLNHIHIYHSGGASGYNPGTGEIYYEIEFPDHARRKGSVFFLLRKARGALNCDSNLEIDNRLKEIAGEISGFHEVSVKRGTILGYLCVAPIKAIRLFINCQWFKQEGDAISANALFEFKYAVALKDIYFKIFGIGRKHSLLESLAYGSSEDPEINSCLENIHNIVLFGENLHPGEHLKKALISFIEKHKGEEGLIVLANSKSISVKFSIPKIIEFLSDAEIIKLARQEMEALKNGRPEDDWLYQCLASPEGIKERFRSYKKMIDILIAWAKAKGHNFDIIIGVSNFGVIPDFLAHEPVEAKDGGSMLKEFIFGREFSIEEKKILKERPAYLLKLLNFTEKEIPQINGLIQKSFGKLSIINLLRTRYLLTLGIAFSPFIAALLIGMSVINIPNNILILLAFLIALPVSSGILLRLTQLMGDVRSMIGVYSPIQTKILIKPNIYDDDFFLCLIDHEIIHFLKKAGYIRQDIPFASAISTYLYLGYIRNYIRENSYARNRNRILKAWYNILKGVSLVKEIKDPDLRMKKAKEYARAHYDILDRIISILIAPEEPDYSYDLGEIIAGMAWKIESQTQRGGDGIKYLRLLAMGIDVKTAEEAVSEGANPGFIIDKKKPFWINDPTSGIGKKDGGVDSRAPPKIRHNASPPILSRKSFQNDSASISFRGILVLLFLAGISSFYIRSNAPKIISYLANVDSVYILLALLSLLAIGVFLIITNFILSIFDRILGKRHKEENIVIEEKPAVIVSEVKIKEEKPISEEPIFEDEPEVMQWWNTSFEEAKRDAEKTGRKMLIYFAQDISKCSACKMMQQEVFSDTRLQELLKNNFICVKIEKGEDEQIWNQYDVNATPTLIFTDSTGKEMLLTVVGGRRIWQIENIVENIISEVNMSNIESFIDSMLSEQARKIIKAVSEQDASVITETPMKKLPVEENEELIKKIIKYL
ncbi:MAG: thioredoxin family protein, partial [Candidatus Omnitrophica bacterium]|nr:thioredoxin family protein [Candidatus Omnitrophota bacterium]